MQETDSGDLLQFHQQATTFNLNVVLVGKKLKITLQDFTQWLLYSREYTQQDIGDEIHKKVDLTDLYFSLVYSQGQKVKNSDQKNEQEKQCIKEYSFGQIIKRGQRKCYDITKGGKLRIYCIGYDHKNGQQIYHESKLQLTKIRQLNEIQIITEKFLLEKRQHTKKFQRQLQKIKIQNKKLQQCYIQVKIQNKKMEQKLKHTQQQNQETKQQIKILKQQQIKTNQQFKQNKQALKQCMKQLEKYKTSLTPITQKLNQYNPKIQALQTAVKKYKEQGFNNLYIFSLPQTNSNKFNIYSNRIQFLENNSWTQYVFNQKIPYNCDYVFKIKIIKTSARNIMIGVVDYPKQKNVRTSYNNPNALAYYGVNGYKYPLNQSQGGGYSQGQTVQINVNLTNKTVKWFVSGSQRATGTQDSLADQTRSYYPFIQLYSKNDVVAWSFE